MKHDPADAHWIDRDRFVLSCGHASMLLYSTLHLTGLRRLARRPQELPPARLARPPATPSTATPPASRSPPARSARASRTAVGMALAERMLAARFNRDGHEIVDHHTYVIASDGDLQEGVAVRGRLARRPPRPRPADRLLRRQPHLDRGRHRHHLHRGRRRPLRGLRLAGPAPRRGHRRSTRIDGGVDERQGRHRPPDADRRPHAHRLRLAEQAGHARGARLAARRGGDPAHQGGLRLAQRRSRSSCPTGVSTHYREAVAARRRAARPTGSEQLRRPTAASSPSWPRARAHRSRASCPTAGTPTSRAQARRRQGHDRHPQGVRRTSSSGRPRSVPELVGGSADLAPSTLTLIKDAESRQRRQLRRPQPALRHPRARHGRDRQRPHAAAASAPSAPASSSSATT